MSACDSLATSETIADAVEDDEALESVDDDTVEVVDALDDELDDCSAASRLVRSVSSADSRLLALDELSVELDEVESVAPGGGPPGGGPPTPPGPPALWLVELWLLSELTPPSCDRKLSTAADSATVVMAESDDETALLAEALDDAEAVALELP